MSGVRRMRRKRWAFFVRRGVCHEAAKHGECRAKGGGMAYMSNPSGVTMPTAVSQLQWGHATVVRVTQSFVRSMDMLYVLLCVSAQTPLSSLSGTGIGFGVGPGGGV